MAERVHASMRVGDKRRQRREDDAGRAEHDRQASRPVDSDAERSRGLVARPADLRALVHLGQPFVRQLEQLQHLLAPPSPRDVEEERPGGVGRVDRALPGEPEANVILREQNVRDPPVDLGLVPAQPEELGGGEARKRTVSGQLDQTTQADALLDLGALGAGALIVPEDRRPQHRVVVAEGDEAVHLAREAERVAVPPAELGQGRLARPPPVLGILLGPARVRGRERVLVLDAGEHFTRRRDRDRLDAGRADVQSGEPHAPSAAYTSSYARTASFCACAARRAASSILAATPSMNRHCRTLRSTAPTASSV